MRGAVDGGLGGGAAGAGFHDADDAVVIEADADVASEGFLGWEKLEGDVVTEDADRRGLRR
jgi:hypothetical protein